jgi:hypothetical protein
MPTARVGAMSFVVDGKIWVVGGNGHIPGGSTAPILTTDIYDPATDSWSAAPGLLPDERIRWAGILANGGIYAIFSTDLPQLYRYRMTIGDWELVSTAPLHQVGFGAASIGNRIHLIGGGDPKTGLHQVWDADGDTVTVDVTGLSFAGDAFVDAVAVASGTWSPAFGVGDGSNVIGHDTNTALFCAAPPCALDLTFTDNVLINGLGDDLAVFELGDTDWLTITIAGVTKQYQPSYTGFNHSSCTGCVNHINLVTIDLDDFGVSAGVALTEIRAESQGVYGSNPSYAAFGAINSGSGH